MENSLTETRTYVGEIGPHAYAVDGYAGLRTGQRYTATPQPSSGTVFVSAVGAKPGSGGVTLRPAEWAKWFAE